MPPLPESAFGSLEQAYAVNAMLSCYDEFVGRSKG